MEIIPAILPKDFRELESSIETIRGLTSYVQVDVCDGRFVHSSTWPYKKQDRNFEAILHEERGLPAWEDIEYEMDLMIDKPETEVMNWVTAGASSIIIHVESTDLERRPENLRNIIEELSGLVEIGLAINIDTPNDVLFEYLMPKDGSVSGKNESPDGSEKSTIGFVQFMGIAKIGFQGQPFDERVLQKIKDFKKKCAELKINVPVSVDGGVSQRTAPLLKAAGADRLVAGSAIFAAEIPAEALRVLQSV